jgi:hypothetical protein
LIVFGFSFSTSVFRLGSLRSGLIAYYPLDGNANDYSGNGNNGTLRGTFVKRADRFGFSNLAYTFDGSSNYIVISNGLSFNFNDSFSLSFWAIPVGVQPNCCPRFFDKSQCTPGSANVDGWSVFQNQNDDGVYKLRFAKSTIGYPSSNLITLSAGVWTHIVLMKQGVNSLAYLNGVLSTSGTFTSASMSNNGNLPLLIGATNFGRTQNPSNVDQFYKGGLDDIAIFNRPLSPDEIFKLYLNQVPTSQPSRQPSSQPTKQPLSYPTGQPSSQPSLQPSSSPTSTLRLGLVAYYPFDGGSSGDLSGNGYHGTVYGTAYQIVADRFGFPSSAFQLSGSNAYIELPGQPFNFQNSFSFSIWVYPFGTQTSYAVILDKSSWLTGTGFTGGFFFNQEADVLNFMRLGYIYTSGFSWTSSPSNLLTVNKWNHVVITKKDDFVNIYLNSVNVLSVHSAHIPIVDNGNKPLIIGARNDGNTNPASGTSSFYNGIVDDIYFYNRELSVNEVKELYQFETPTSQPSRKPSSQPTSQPSSQPSLQPTIQPSIAILGSVSSLREGLIACYPFNEGSANDKCGNGNNGIMKGGVNTVPDRFGIPKGAMRFDGSSGFIEIPGSQFNFVNDMSISFWMNASSSQIGYAILFDKSYYHNNPPLPSFAASSWTIFQDVNNVNLYKFGYVPASGFVTSSGLQVSANSWKHVVFTKHDGILSVYYNGVLLSSSTFSSDKTILANGNMPLLIGALNQGPNYPVSTLNSYYRGCLDDIFIYNRTLTSDEVKLLYNFDSPTSQPSREPSSQPSTHPTIHISLSSALTQGLIAYYPFDRGNANDMSGNGIHGTVHGNGIKAVPNRLGVSSSAYQFNGTNAYIELPGQPFNFHNSFSFSVWVYPSSSQQDYARILDKSHNQVNVGDVGGFMLQQDAGTLNRLQVGYVYAPGNILTSASFTLTTNTWAHIVFTKLNDYIAVYRDTVVMTAGPSNPIPIVGNGDKPLLIGAANGAYSTPASGITRCYNGIIDDLFFFNRSLSAAEVSSLYQFVSATSQPTGQPSTQPTRQPTIQPSSQPSGQPCQPSGQPSRQPSNQPTSRPSHQPTVVPSAQPTYQPTLVVVNSYMKAGLVAYYPFDGNSKDKTLNGNNGIMKGAASFDMDRFDRPSHCLSLDGINSYVEITNGRNFNFHEFFSISFWIFPSSVQPLDGTVLDKSNQDGGATYASFKLKNGNVNSNSYNFFISHSTNYAGVTAPFQLFSSVWSHVTIVKENDYHKVYKNGMIITEGTSIGQVVKPNDNLPLLIGAANFGQSNPASSITRYWSGKIDDLFFFNRSLSDIDVLQLYQQNMPSSSPTTQPTSLPSSQPSIQPSVHIASSSIKQGLVAYYPFDGGNANDKSGNGYNGIMKGNFNTIVSDRFGILNHAINFNGLTNSIVIPYGNAFNFNINFTISFWIKGLSSNQHQQATILDKSHWDSSLGLTGGFTVKYDTNSIFYFKEVSHPRNSSLLNFNPFSVNVWNHIVIMKERNHLQIFRNLQNIANKTLLSSSIRSNGNYPLCIGAQLPPIISNFPVNFFTGCLDDLFFFNRSLSTLELEVLYGYHSPTSYPSSQPSLAPSVDHPDSLGNGLILYLPFYKGDLEDKSGNHLSVTNVGATLAVDHLSRVNSAYVFTNNHYLSIAYHPLLDLAISDYSIAAWIMIDAASSSERIISHGVDGGVTPYSPGYVLRISCSASVCHLVQAFICQTSSSSASTISLEGVTNLLIGKWYFVVATINHSGNAILYVNGVWDNSMSISSSNPCNKSFSGHPVEIGSFKSGTAASFEGKIDEIRLYNRVLTQNEVVTLHNFRAPTSQPSTQPSSQPTLQPTFQTKTISLRQGLVASYSFDDGSVNDKSGNGNHGLKRGGLTSVPDRFGRTSHAMSFNGVTGFIEIPHGNQFNFVNDMCISFWIKASCDCKVSDWMNIFDKSSESILGYLTGGWRIQQMNVINKIAFAFVKTSTQYGSSQSLRVGIYSAFWLHIVVVKSGTTISYYVNGEFYDSEIASVPRIMSNGNSPLIIGGLNREQTSPVTSVSYPFYGSLDDIFIYNRTLTTNEITSLYLDDNRNSSFLIFDYRPSSCVADGVIYGFIGNHAYNFPRYDAKLFFGNESNCITNEHWKFGKSAISLDSSLMQYISLPPFLIPSGGMSFAFWVRSRNCSYHGRIFDFTSNTQNIFYSSNNYAGVGGSSCATPPQCNTDVWCFIVWVLIPSNPPVYKIYVNGTIWSSYSTSTLYPTSTVISSNYIGKSHGGDHPYCSMLLGSFQLYNFVLSTAQVKNLYDIDINDYPTSQPTVQPSVHIESTSLKQGLVAFYPFDKGSANDKSGSGYNGVKFGGVMTTNDRFGNSNSALSFGGKPSDFIQVPGDSFNFYNSLAFSLWVYPLTTQLQSSCSLLDKGYASSTSSGEFILDHSLTQNNQFRFSFITAFSSPFQSPYVQLKANSWNHLVISKSGNPIKLYINGSLIIQTSVGSSPAKENGNIPLLIGYNFTGYLDDIFIYNRALTESEIMKLYSFDSPTSQPSSQPSMKPTFVFGDPTGQPSSQPTLQASDNFDNSIMNLKNDLLAFYSFDGTTNDKSGNSNNGVLRGNAVFQTDRFNRNSHSLYLDGNQSYVEIVNGRNFNFHHSFSISFWILSSSSQSNYATIFDKSCGGDGTMGGWGFHQDNHFQQNYQFFIVRDVNDIGSSGNISVSSNSWTHIVIVKNHSDYIVYRNTVAVNAGFIGSAIQSNGNSPLLIGAANMGQSIPASSVQRYWKGTLDDLYIFNRSLTMKEVSQLFQLDVPTSHPSSQPSCQPSLEPTTQPSAHPSYQPTSLPSRYPSSAPTIRPSVQPSCKPSSQPSCHSSSAPTIRPSVQPSCKPSSQPSCHPSSAPTIQPTVQPSCEPSLQPTVQPTSQPSVQPTIQPTLKPSSQPASQPSSQPSRLPSCQPTCNPTYQPSAKPSHKPSFSPSGQPSLRPSNQPSSLPSSQPSMQPSSTPSLHPTCQPSSFPTSQPSSQPSSQPTVQPSTQPIPFPSCHPSVLPTGLPTVQPSCQSTSQPSSLPSSLPSSQPSDFPSTVPSFHPSTQPTSLPTKYPSSFPTADPSGIPSSQPSLVPTCLPTSLPSVVPSSSPTGHPSSVPSVAPSRLPSDQPSAQPSHRPSSQPFSLPSSCPSSFPSSFPSFLPISLPSMYPSSSPTSFPSCVPTSEPSSIPSSTPSICPTKQPAGFPSVIPFSQPSCVPSAQPTIFPSASPILSPVSRPSTTPSSSPITYPTSQPSSFPTLLPTGVPTEQPFSSPSLQPFSTPSSQPSRKPSSQPSAIPTRFPSSQPSSQPQCHPTVLPSEHPTSYPSLKSKAPSSSLHPHLPSISLLPNPSVITSFKQVNFLLSASMGINAYRNIILPSKSAVPVSFSTASAPSIFQGKSYLLLGSPSLPSKFDISRSNSPGIQSLFLDSSGFSFDTKGSRSIAFGGDFNRDRLSELLIGDPITSKIYIFYSNRYNQEWQNVSEGFSVVGGKVGSSLGLGWAVSSAGDWNGDGIDDIVISAVYSSRCYVIYGKQSMNISASLSSSIGVEDYLNRNLASSSSSSSTVFSASLNGMIFGIQNDPSLILFGVSISKIPDFNGDGFSDLVISASGKNGANRIFIIFGRKTFSPTLSFVSPFLVNSLSSIGVLLIVAPTFSFSGLSLVGMRDVNGDGLGDLLVGSIPYNKGYLNQVSYLLYGSSQYSSTAAISLASLEGNITGEGRGCVITGGGLVVSAVGDINNDGLEDMMITSYLEWQGKIGSYLLTYPTRQQWISNIPSVRPSSLPSSSPSHTRTLFPSIAGSSIPSSMQDYPSSFPSSSLPSSLPTAATISPSISFTSPPPLAAGSSRSPSVIPTVTPTTAPVTTSPSRLPTWLPTLSPTFVPSFSPTTIFPSRSPTVSPSTLSPTFRPSRRPSHSPAPSSVPTAAPSLSVSSQGKIISIQSSGEYVGSNGEESFYFFDVSSSNIIVKGNQGSKHYKISSSVRNSTIIIVDFDIKEDQLDFSDLSSTAAYSYSTEPLTLHFGFPYDLSIVLSSHANYDLNDESLILPASSSSSSSSSSTVSSSSFSFSSIGKALSSVMSSTLVVAIVIFVGLLLIMFLVTNSRRSSIFERKNGEMKLKVVVASSSLSVKEKNEIFPLSPMLKDDDHLRSVDDLSTKSYVNAEEDESYEENNLSDDLDNEEQDDMEEIFSDDDNDNNNDCELLHTGGELFNHENAYYDSYYYEENENDKDVGNGWKTSNDQADYFHHDEDFSEEKKEDYYDDGPSYHHFSAGGSVEDDQFPTFEGIQEYPVEDEPNYYDYPIHDNPLSTNIQEYDVENGLSHSYDQTELSSTCTYPFLSYETNSFTAVGAEIYNYSFPEILAYPSILTSDNVEQTSVVETYEEEEEGLFV